MTFVHILNDTIMKKDWYQVHCLLNFIFSFKDCSTDYGQTDGWIKTDFKEGQFHVTPVICRYTISLPKYYTIDLQIHRVQLQNPDILSVGLNYFPIHFFKFMDFLFTQLSLHVLHILVHD